MERGAVSSQLRLNKQTNMVGPSNPKVLGRTSAECRSHTWPVLGRVRGQIGGNGIESMNKRLREMEDKRKTKTYLTNVLKKRGERKKRQY